MRTPPGVMLRAVEEALRLIGYEENLLLRDYAFAEIFEPRDSIRRVDLAAFAQEPPSYRSACFGVVLDVNDHELANYRSLGAPQLLQVRDGALRRWKVPAAGELQLLDEVRVQDLPYTFDAHRDEWSPNAMLRARSIALGGARLQGDFYDAGLLPAIETVARTKLDELLRRVIAASEVVYNERHLHPPDYALLFRLVFRLLAAKLLSDRGHAGAMLATDADEALEVVAAYYFQGESPEPILGDPETRRVAWTQLRSSLHLQNVSPETLAYVYENTLVDPITRRTYGTHSTPPAVAEYIVHQLPFEEIPLTERRVFEPFAGHAALLVAALGKLRTLLPQKMGAAERHEHLTSMLTGMEKDSFAREVGRLSLLLADYPNANGWRLLDGDVFNSQVVSKELAQARIVLCNPPFGRFSLQEREAYISLRSTNKAADTLIRVLDRAPDLLGFVLPKTFADGSEFRQARRRLFDTYRRVELLQLPDEAFQHSQMETVLLMASGRGGEIQALTTGTVPRGGFEAFARTGLPQARESVSGPDLRQRVESPAELGPLREVWRALRPLESLASVAEVHRGIEYILPLDENRAELVSAIPRPGFEPGIDRVTAAFEPFVVRDHVFLNMDPALMLYKAYLRDWRRPKVLVTAARRGRGRWVLTAVPDRTGLVAYQNFSGIWPTGDLPVEVLAALLNGPVANAFLYSHQTSRHNKIGTLRNIPVPPLSAESRRRISSLVESYQAIRRFWMEHPAVSGRFERRCTELLIELDAEILAAYDLPPRLERLLLDLFADEPRPGPVNFTRYYPADFHPALPLWRLVSGDVEAASARRTLERVPALDIPEVAEVMDHLGDLET